MKTSVKICVGFVILLLGVRLILPFAVEKYINGLLQEIPEYQGRVQDIDINLLKGAYAINDISISKINKDIAVPFIRVERIDLFVQWQALLSGKIVSKMHFDHPELNFIDSKDASQMQNGKGVDWTEPIKKLLPIKINKLTVENGEIHYHNFSVKPQVDLYLHKLKMEVTNLRNVNDSDERLPSEVKLSGLTIGGGKVKVDGAINVLKKTPDMDVDMSLESVDLPALNAYLKSYAGVDAERGVLGIFSELVIDNSRVNGYIKPIIRDMTIVSWEKDSNEPIELLWESLAGFFVEIFENQKEDQFATKIPFTGSIEDPETDTITTIWSILSNAFVEAFSRSTSGEISFERSNSTEQ